MTKIESNVRFNKAKCLFFKIQFPDKLIIYILKRKINK